LRIKGFEWDDGIDEEYYDTHGILKDILEEDIDLSLDPSS